jgi:hypothetical protein
VCLAAAADDYDSKIDELCIHNQKEQRRREMEREKEEVEIRKK